MLTQGRGPRAVSQEPKLTQILSKKAFSQIWIKVDHGNKYNTRFETPLIVK